uniref:RNase III domain-containing protein n=1 Tax=viral metagenome TaxID=1070528 RepID=A0A6C0LVQ9_9ZZZZ
MNITNSNEIYNGDRGKLFQKMIIRLLKRAKIREENIDLLTNEYGMMMYGQAFTAASADVDVNYEMFEQLGDVTANKFIVWYMYRRFPQLRHPLGVKVVARLRINYGARQSFSEIGDRLGFWDFISASEEDRGRKKKDLLEDCIESFIGVTEFLIDEAYRPGVGHAVVYDILQNIFDEIHISLRYEDLYDAKTRLKEVFDFHKESLGKLKYTNSRDVDSGLFTAHVYNGNNSIGYGVASKLKDAEQKAAVNGMKQITISGFSKPVPPEYKKFNN